MGSFRKDRVAELVRGFLGRELVQLLDPRLGFVTITDVEMSPDLKFAKVFWTTFGGTTIEQAQSLDENRLVQEELHSKKVTDATAALVGVKPLLKKRIGAELKLRYVPELHFIYDSSSVRGSRIDLLLDQVRREGE